MRKRTKRTERVPENVGGSMRRWRRAQDRTLISVAAQIKVTKGHLSQVETGQGNLSLPKFLEFCRAIGVPASKILHDSVLSKDRDFERLADALLDSIGIAALNWLARLEPKEAREALRGAQDAVDLLRLRAEERAKAKRKPATVQPIQRKQ